MPTSGERLDVLKALGDNTRYAIYLELARSPSPLSTAQIADSLGLHGNTVRPHLERMKEVGLLESQPEVTGSVGRPQKLYSLAEDAPSLGLEPPVFPMLARMLLGLARASKVEPEVVIEAGRDEGRRRSRAAGRGHSDDFAGGDEDSGISPEVGTAVADLVTMQEQLGFDPAVVVDDDPEAVPTASVAFTRCPFAELAAQNPEIVCTLHRGLVEGFIEGGSVLELTSFNDVTSRQPCRMELARVSGAPDTLGWSS